MSDIVIEGHAYPIGSDRCRHAGCNVSKADLFYDRDAYRFGGSPEASNANRCLGVR